MKKIITKDNSITYYNEEFRDYYHTQSGAREEAFEKHAKALGVSGNSVIFDICFGLGYNSAAALDMADGNIIIYCFENDREILKNVLNINADFKSYNVIRTFVRNFLIDGDDEYKDGDVRLIMVFGDARQKIKELKDKADFVFFDPFSPRNVPGMWTKEFFVDIRDRMNIGGKLSTYSCAKFVLNNLKEAGFTIKEGPVIGRNSPSTIALK